MRLNCRGGERCERRWPTPGVVLAPGPVPGDHTSGNRRLICVSRSVVKSGCADGGAGAFSVVGEEGIPCSDV